VKTWTSRRHRSVNPGEQGFTLLEVLMAIAILGLMMAVVSLSFSGTFRLRDVMEDNGRRDRMARACLSLLADELTMGRNLPGAPWLGKNGEADGQPADLLAFVSTGHVRMRPEVPESELSRLLYTRRGSALVRVALPNPYLTDVKTIEPTDVATGVIALNIRYYDAKLSAWTNEWDSVRKQGLPSAILIELTLEDARKEPATFTQWITLPRQSA
jgi:general secretion pathway protein J